jgi:nitrile hydratase
MVIENTPATHNLIVCTLCSCYPRSLLGEPPAWYVSKAYRSRAVREPRKVLREFGLTLADSVEVRVHDSNADLRYIVLPMRPKGTDDMSEAELAALVSRDCLVGAALPGREST